MADKLIEARAAVDTARAALLALIDTHAAAAKAGNRLLNAEETAAQAAAETALKVAEQAVTLEERKIELAKAHVRNGGAPSIEVGKDNREDQPWGDCSTKAGQATALGTFALAVKRSTLGQGVDPRLAAIAAATFGNPQAAATGMGEAYGPDGGFAVPTEMGAGIEREMFETGAILNAVDARDISGNAIAYNVMRETSRVDGSRQGGVLGYWIDEGESPDATKIALAKMELKLRKVGCLGYLTEELEADAPALGAELRNAFTEELQFQVENKVWRGGGAGSPLGFLNAPCLVTVAKETGQAAGSINTTNISKMWQRMHPRSRANSAWFINADAEPQLDELSIPSGTAALEPRFVTYGPDGILRIKGRPVIVVEYAETVGTVGDIVLADFKRYRLIRKGGVQQASSIHVRFAQGENTFRAIYRVDGQPVPRAAITPFKGTNTLSPFVALATRA